MIHDMQNSYRYLCDGVVDIDGWHLEFALCHHFVEIVYTGCSLLR